MEEEKAAERFLNPANIPVTEKVKRSAAVTAGSARLLATRQRAKDDDDALSVHPGTGRTTRRLYYTPLRFLGVDRLDPWLTEERKRDRPSVGTVQDLDHSLEWNKTPRQPPDVDEGWAWVILFALFLYNFLMTGTSKLIGILYVEFLDLFQAGTVTTSWLGFTFSLSLVLSSTVGGHLKDGLNFHQIRLLLFFAYILTSFGIAAGGWMPVLPGTIISMGLVGGACEGLAAPATLSLLGVYFHRRRGLASTIAFCGGTLSSMVIPFLITILVEAYSMRGAMLIYAALALNALMVPAALSSSRKVEEYCDAADRFEAEQQQEDLDRFRRTKTPVRGSELRLDRLHTRRPRLLTPGSSLRVPGSMGPVSGKRSGSDKTRYLTAVYSKI